MITINSLTIPHSTERLARRLVEHFGGYTRVDGQGEWYDTVKQRTIWEWVSVYTVAFDNNPNNAELFRLDARTEGIVQMQDEVFITIDGKGEFLNLRGDANVAKVA